MMTRVLKCPADSKRCDYKIHLDASWVFTDKVDKAPPAYLDEIERFLAHLMDVHGPNAIYLLIPTLEGKYE